MHCNIIMHQQSQSPETRQLYLSQKVRNIAYNFKYMAIGYLQQYQKGSLIGSNQRAYILGNTFENSNQQQQKINKQIYELFRKTIWITYRTGFPNLPNEMDDSYVTDTGWGCMIRVGQMLFAQVLKKHRQVESKEDIQKIIQMFSDFDRTSIFSIQNIAKLARVEFGLKPGAWYNPSQISFILNQLFQKKKPKQYSDLCFKVFNSGNLFFDQLIDKMTKKKQKCKCEIPEDHVICTKCNKTQKSMAIVVLVRIGLDKSQTKYLNILNQLMESKHCQGVIGGKPEKALYFVGRIANEYIYLDPHYVQQAKKQIQVLSESYFCGSFRKCKNTSIDPSLGICFYLRDLNALNEFYRYLNFVKTQNQQNFFIFTAKQTPFYAREKPRVQPTVDQDYFQEL